MTPSERPLTVPQVAERLGASPRTVVRHIKAGTLQAVDVRTRRLHAYRVHPDVLETFIASRTVEAE